MSDVVATTYSHSRLPSQCDVLLCHAEPNDSTKCTTTCAVTPVQTKAALTALLKICSTAMLVVEDDKFYIMQLQMPGADKRISVQIIISALHKWTRLKKSAEIIFMVGCFFTGVSRSSGDPQAGAFKGKITQVLNRLAIAAVEDGPFLVMDTDGQNAVVYFCGFHVWYVW